MLLFAYSSNNDLQGKEPMVNVGADGILKQYTTMVTVKHLGSVTTVINVGLYVIVILQLVSLMMMMMVVVVVMKVAII